MGEATRNTDEMNANWRKVLSRQKMAHHFEMESVCDVEIMCMYGYIRIILGILKGLSTACERRGIIMETFGSKRYNCLIRSSIGGRCLSRH